MLNRRPHSRDGSRLPATGGPSGRRCLFEPRRLSAGALIAALAALFTLFGVSESRAACVAGAEDWRPAPRLIVWCTDGVCTEGFMLRAPTLIAAVGECGEWIWVMDELESASDPQLQAIQALRIPVASGIYEIGIRECSSLSPAVIGTMPSAVSLRHICQTRPRLSRLSATGDAEAFERLRAYWRSIASPNPIMARLQFLRYGISGLLVELAASLAALSAPFLLIVGNSLGRSGLFRRALICASIQVTALGFAGWRFLYAYPLMHDDTAEFTQRIDIACAAVILLAMLILGVAVLSASRAVRADG